jgi:hypothetical protein
VTSNSASGNTPPQSAQPSTSALSSRRNSIEYESRQRFNKFPICGSHYSHTSDADIPTSSQVVVRPARSELKALQVHVHGISYSGAKSRVETQIRTRIELVRPALTAETKGAMGTFERIGTFTHVKLPPLTGTKRKSKKPKPTDVAPEKTLFMDATVVRATAPHDRVHVCPSCQQREKKRAQRKRTSTSKKQDKQDEEEQYSHEDLVEYGIDPDAPDAQKQARKRAMEEDEKRIVVFNCGDYIDFNEGQCVLPTRITCYCRHHKEKTGFCLIFTMRDYRGELIATGSTPPIMITDDHKSVAAAQAAQAAAMSSMSTKRSDGARSRGVSIEALDGSTLRSINRESARRKQHSHRATPYGNAEDRASRRGTMSSTTMTPFATTGQNTPAAGLSPPSMSDMNNPEFWQVFASMSGVGSSPPIGSRSSIGAQTPHEILSPVQHTSPAQQTVNPINNNEWLANFANQGSLSSQTLQLSPQSLPGFDMNSFTRSVQQSSQQAGDDATLQQLLMLARSLPGMGPTPNLDLNASTGSSAPVPSISKLIPGEGPTTGGIEVTVLGENFTDNLTCLFGDVPAISTRVWGSNTLLCILPPSASPGPVAVSIKPTHGEVQTDQDGMARSLQLFTYTDTTDRALMELALQVVGLQMTGQMQTARDVAMRVVGSGSNQVLTSTSPSSQTSGQQQMRSAVTGLFAGGQSNQSFQDSVLQFLTTLDESAGVQRRDAIRLANKQGHTLLHLTVILGFHRLALDLIQRGCPINARDINGYTALHFAALHGRMTIARSLLANGARVDVESEAGRYPIDVARESEQVDVEVLLDDFESEDESDSESDWSTDVDEEEEVDEEHIADRLGGVSVPKEEKALVMDEKELVEKASTLDEKELLKASVQSSENEKKSFEAILGLKGLVSGGMDLAQKWPNAAIGKIGMPMALHDRLQSMQMPTVSVFQMVMPPNFMSWSGSSGGSEETQPATDKGKAREQNAEESSRTLTMWRNIFEESALWINPLYSPPPPTYESSVETTKDKGRSKDFSSRFPAIAEASPDSPHKDNEVRRRVPNPNDMTSSRSASWHPDHQHSSLSSTMTKAQSSSALPTRSHNLATATKTKTAPSPKSKEDPMLVYFWLPILVFVILLLCFASPSSVLSYKDLISYMPV